MNQLGIVGLGKMGANMARRLSRSGIKLTVFDQNESTTTGLAKEIGATAAANLSGLVEQLASPRRIWLMLPAGEITEKTIQALRPMLKAGDILIDGANTFYKDTIRRSAELATQKIEYVDVGVSGGIWGEKNGYAMMIGGTPAAVAQLKTVFEALAPAPDKGWLHCGPHGSGHYVKMIHNGIEYGMMQAFAEGLSLLQNKKEFELNIGEISEMWRHGSVVRSWLLDLIAEFLNKENALQGVAPFVADSGEGRWTAMEAIEQGIPSPVMTLALISRFSSQGKDDFASQLLAMMRRGFGGHDIKSK
jgi:6-phosphogluconate dehydrogenase